MTAYFLDTSALAKRYVVEPGTGWINLITDPSAKNEIIVASLTVIEVMSSVNRLQREDRIDIERVKQIRLALKRHQVKSYRVINLTKVVSQRTQDLLERHPLRASDAVQLASALITSDGFKRTEENSITFVSADRRLNEAARAEGLSVEDPNAHG